MNSRLSLMVILAVTSLTLIYGLGSTNVFVDGLNQTDRLYAANQLPEKLGLEELVENGALRKAVRKGQRHLDEPPNHPVDMRWMVEAYLRLGESENAIRWANKALEQEVWEDHRSYTSSYAHQFWYLMGKARKNQGQYEEALQNLNRAIEVASPTGDWYKWPHLQIGHVHRRQERYDSAVDSYKRAVDLNRNETWGTGRFWVGRAYQLKGDYSQAISSYSAAISRSNNPDWKWPRFHLAETYHATGDYERAVYYFSLVLEIDSDWDRARRAREKALDQLPSRRGLQPWPDQIKPEMSFGNAPDPPYPTGKQSNGIRHRNPTRFWLGDTHTATAKPVYNASKNDGLETMYPLDITVTNGNHRGGIYLNVLADRSGSSGWTEEADWIVRNESVPVPPGQSRRVSLGNRVGNASWIRITVTPRKIEDYAGTGVFELGETEDYRVRTFWLPDGVPPKPDTDPTRKLITTEEEEGFVDLNRVEGGDTKNNQPRQPFEGIVFTEMEENAPDATPGYTPSALPGSYREDRRSDIQSRLSHCCDSKQAIQDALARAAAIELIVKKKQAMKKLANAQIEKQNDELLELMQKEAKLVDIYSNERKLGDQWAFGDRSLKPELTDLLTDGQVRSIEKFQTNKQRIEMAEWVLTLTTGAYSVGSNVVKTGAKIFSKGAAVRSSSVSFAQIYSRNPGVINVGSKIGKEIIEGAMYQTARDEVAITDAEWINEQYANEDRTSGLDQFLKRYKGDLSGFIRWQIEDRLKQIRRNAWQYHQTRQHFKEMKKQLSNQIERLEKEQSRIGNPEYLKTKKKEADVCCRSKGVCNDGSPSNPHNSLDMSILADLADQDLSHGLWKDISWCRDLYRKEQKERERERKKQQQEPETEEDDTSRSREPDRPRDRENRRRDVPSVEFEPIHSDNQMKIIVRGGPPNSWVGQDEDGLMFLYKDQGPGGELQTFPPGYKMELNSSGNGEGKMLLGEKHAAFWKGEVIATWPEGEEDEWQ